MVNDVKQHRMFTEHEQQAQRTARNKWNQQNKLLRRNNFDLIDFYGQWFTVSAVFSRRISHWSLIGYTPLGPHSMPFDAFAFAQRTAILASFVICIDLTYWLFFLCSFVLARHH